MQADNIFPETSLVDDGEPVQKIDMGESYPNQVDFLRFEVRDWYPVCLTLLLVCFLYLFFTSSRYYTSYILYIRHHLMIEIKEDQNKEGWDILPANHKLKKKILLSKCNQSIL